MMKTALEKKMTFNPELLRHAMRTWTSGVTIVTASHNGQAHGMTVSSFTSISLAPPRVLVSLRTSSRTYELVTVSGAFGVTILSAEQKDISERFAGRNLDDEDRFEGLKTETLLTGSPLITGGLAWFDCRVEQIIPVGMNTVFIADVMEARYFGEGQPLTYFNRDYHWLAE
jgi:flavin reductase (DIM6/NTAB) family NADH-FMN oxidoreductase RutF